MKNLFKTKKLISCLLVVILLASTLFIQGGFIKLNVGAANGYVQKQTWSFDATGVAEDFYEAGKGDPYLNLNTAGTAVASANNWQDFHNTADTGDDNVVKKVENGVYSMNMVQNNSGSSFFVSYKLNTTLKAGTSYTFRTHTWTTGKNAYWLDLHIGWSPNYLKGIHSGTDFFNTSSTTFHFLAGTQNGSTPANASDNPDNVFSFDFTPTTDIAAGNWLYFGFDHQSGNGAGTTYYTDGATLYEAVMADEEGNHVFNGNFETDTSGWNCQVSDMAVSDAQAKRDNKSLALTTQSDKHTTTTVSVEKNKTYLISFYRYADGSTWTKWGAVAGSFNYNTTSIDTIMMGQMIGYANQWVLESCLIESGDKNTITIAFRNAGTNRVYIDDVKVIEVENGIYDQSIVKNGSFEHGFTYWKVTSGKENIYLDSDNARTGNMSGKLNKTAQGIYWQEVDVEKNNYYEFSFYRKSAAASYSKYAVIPYSKFDATKNIDNMAPDSLTDRVTFTLDGKTDWARESRIVYSGNEDKLVIAFQCVSTTVDTYIDDVAMTKLNKAEYESTIVKNGGFENGTGPWKWDSAGRFLSLETSETKGGNYSVKVSTSNTTRSWQVVDVEKNTDYVFSLYHKYGDDTQFAIVAGESGACNLGAGSEGVLASTTLKNSSDRWRMSSLSVNSGENTKLSIAVGTTKANSTTLIDNVAGFKVDSDQIVLNGEFTGGNVGWDVDEAVWSTEAIGYQDTVSMHAKNGHYNILSQAVALPANKNYELSFYYKGNVPDLMASVALSIDGSFDSDALLVSSPLTDSDTWKKHTMQFNSENAGMVFIAFQSMDGCDFYIDNVEIKEIQTAVTNPEIVRPLLQLDERLNRTPYDLSPYVAKDGKNVFTDSSFENSEINTDCAQVIDDSDAWDGSKVLKFTAGDTEKFFVKTFKVEKNTVYYIGVFSKMYADDYNAAINPHFSYGVANPDTGDFLVTATPTANNDRYLTTKTQMIVSGADGDWHYTNFRFNTKTYDTISFVVRGQNATAYLDDIQLFKASDRESFNPPIRALEGAQITNTAPTLLDSDRNIFTNFDMNGGDTYWSNYQGILYDKGMKVEDTGHSIQGNALKYYTTLKHPEGIYYIKWIDVEPNTEYTFSGKYLITKTGKGFFGLINGYYRESAVFSNPVYPTDIVKYRFGEDQFDENYSWQTVAISFNTKDRNRIGFVVFDGGGEAYMDDLRLFKTSTAKELVEATDNFPSTLTTTDDKYTIIDGAVYNATPGTEISALLNKFENKQYIRVYDPQGNEITDYSKALTSGMEIRLMDGPVVKDRATVIIKGDVNYDGTVDGKDITIIVKHLSNEESLDDIQTKAADYDGDSEITIYDISHNSKDYKEDFASFSIEAPEKLKVGDTITISLIAGQDGILGVNGKFVFSEKLSYVSASGSIQGAETSFLEGNSIVYFASAITSGKSTVKSGDTLLEIKLKIGDAKSIKEIYASFTDVYSTTGTDLTKVNTINWNPGATDSTTQEGTGEITEQVVQAKNRLKVLSLKETEISPKFDPEIKEYTATVPFEIDKVTVTAIAADEDATVEIGDTNLEYIGKNNVTVRVISHDGLRRTYNVVVTRLEPENQAAGMGIALTLVIVAAAVLLLGAITVIVIIILKKRKASANK